MSKVIQKVTKLNLEEIIIPFIATFNQAPWNDQWTPETARLSLNELVETPNFYGWMAVENGVCKGALLGHVHHFSAGKTYYMDELFVVQEETRKGIGSALYDAMTEQMQKIKCSGIFLTTLHNSPAFNFYQHQGLIDLPESSVMVGRIASERHDKGQSDKRKR